MFDNESVVAILTEEEAEKIKNINSMLHQIMIRQNELMQLRSSYATMLTDEMNRIPRTCCR